MWSADITSGCIPPLPSAKAVPDRGVVIGGGAVVRSYAERA